MKALQGRRSRVGLTPAPPLIFPPGPGHANPRIISAGIPALARTPARAELPRARAQPPTRGRRGMSRNYLLHGGRCLGLHLEHLRQPHGSCRNCRCGQGRRCGPRHAMALHTNAMPRAEMLPRYLPQNPASNATETRATRRITRLPAYGPATTALATPEREQARFIGCACSIGAPCTNAHAPGSVIYINTCDAFFGSPHPRYTLYCLACR